jgi:hypothetical protein
MKEFFIHVKSVFTILQNFKKLFAGYIADKDKQGLSTALLKLKTKSLLPTHL